MASKNDFKMEQLFTDDQLPDFFRRLADALEGNGETDSELMNDMSAFSSLKLGLKRRYGQTVLKLKMQCEEGNCTIAPMETAPDGTKPKYKSLKKKMKDDFKLIFQASKAGVMPAQEVVEAFVADSELMCQYPGKGDEYYQPYLQATAAFRAAAATNDQQKLDAAVMELNDLKTRCHAEYK